MNQKTIGVIGLGYIGQSLVAALARVGYKVVGIDIDQDKIKHLQQTYEPDIYEPGLSETLKQCKDNVEFTEDYSYLMKTCSTIMITVGTPVKKDDGTPNYDYLNTAILNIGKHLRRGQLIVLKSTVVPGTTEEIVLKLEEISGLKAGEDFYVAFCPERTIEGLALHELYNLPKIIGGINEESADNAAKVLRKLGGKIIKVSSPKIAEICKLVDNLYRAMNIAFGNEIGHICEGLGIGAYEVVSAVNDAYGRTHLFKPGLGADGPCLSKDPLIVKYCGRKIGIDTRIIDACILQNKESTLRIASIISLYIKDSKINKPKISFIGLAFKGFPETDDIRGSPAIKIHDVLQEQFSDIEFKYYDPIIKKFLDSPVSQTLEECILDSNIVVFLTNHQALMNVDVKDILENTSRPLLIIDCWHNLTNIENLREKRDIQIFRIGDGRL